MRENAKRFVEAVAAAFGLPTPILEVGARQPEEQIGFADLRPVCGSDSFYGCDVLPGSGVDFIIDAGRAGLATGCVGTVLCIDTLEHIAEPALAMREMRRALRLDGLLVLSAPFEFPIHHRPDYARFTPEGLARLLESFAATAVFAEGDARSPRTVHAVAIAGDRPDFETCVGSVTRQWADTDSPLIRHASLSAVSASGSIDEAIELSQGKVAEQQISTGGRSLVRIHVYLGGGSPSGRVRLQVIDAQGDVVAESEARTAWFDGEAFPGGGLPSICPRQRIRCRRCCVFASICRGRARAQPCLRDRSMGRSENGSA